MANQSTAEPHPVPGQTGAGASVRHPAIDLRQEGAGGQMVAVSGAWDIRALESRSRVRALREDLSRARNVERWDLSSVQRLDHIGALLLWQTWGKRRPAGLVLLPQHD